MRTHRMTGEGVSGSMKGSNNVCIFTERLYRKRD